MKIIFHCNILINTSGHGGMVDALDSDSSGSNFMEVQVLLTAPNEIKKWQFCCHFLLFSEIFNRCYTG